MGRVFAVFFAVICVVYFFEQFSGRSFGLSDRIHDASDWVVETAGLRVFGG